MCVLCTDEKKNSIVMLIICPVFPLVDSTKPHLVSWDWLQDIFQH